MIIYFVIIADTVGVPTNGQFDITNVVLPLYGTFSVAPAFSKSASLGIKLTQDAQNPQLYSYNHADSQWTKLDSTYDSTSKTISTTTDSFATYVVVSTK